MYACICKAVTDSQIQQAIDNGADYKSLRRDLGVATGCGQCGEFCKKMVRQTRQKLNAYDADSP